MSIEVTPLQSAKTHGDSPVLGKWEDGTPIEITQDVGVYRATAAISQGEVVTYAAAAAGAVPGVVKAPNGVTIQAFGVALHDAAIGDNVRVARDIGWCIVGVATNLANARAVSVDATTAGTVADSGLVTALAATDIGVARSAIADDFFGADIDAILVEFT